VIEPKHFSKTQTKMCTMYLLYCGPWKTWQYSGWSSPIFMIYFRS